MKGWASSSKLHDHFAEKEYTTKKALSDYGFDVTEEDLERNRITDAEHLRICKTCAKVKNLETEYVGQERNGKKYYLRECKACQRAKRNEPVDPEAHKELLGDAPYLAAARLLDQDPKALALLIKHFRPQFKELYEKEKKRIQSQEVTDELTSEPAMV